MILLFEDACNISQLLPPWAATRITMYGGGGGMVRKLFFIGRPFFLETNKISIYFSSETFDKIDMVINLKQLVSRRTSI